MSGYLENWVIVYRCVNGVLAFNQTIALCAVFNKAYFVTPK